jgi:hypothetical protein
MVNVVDPPFSSCTTAVPPSTLNDTPPTGVPPPELTLMVTMPFALYVTTDELSNMVVGTSAVPVKKIKPTGVTMALPVTSLTPPSTVTLYVVPGFKLDAGSKTAVKSV